MTDKKDELPPGWRSNWKKPEETRRANKAKRREASKDVFMEGEVIPPKPRHNQFSAPYVFDEAMKDQIIERLASGQTLKRICSEENMPSYFTVWRREKEDPEFGERMRMAREVAASVFADEVLEISDEAFADYKADGSINYEVIARSKLRADNRKWLISKLDPKRWGDKVQADVTSGGEKIEAKEINPVEGARQIAFMLEMAKRAKSGQEE